MKMIVTLSFLVQADVEVEVNKFESVEHAIFMAERKAIRNYRVGKHRLYNRRLHGANFVRSHEENFDVIVKDGGIYHFEQTDSVPK